MNYHIITQDKFFNAYIEDIYTLHEEANNVFWVRGKKGEMPWLETDKPVEYLPHDKSLYIDKLLTLKPEDKLFVSCYDVFIGQAILESGIQNEVYASVLGAEFYAEPFWYHAHWLFDKQTLRCIKKDEYYRFPKIHWFCRPRNWKYIPRDIRLRREFMPQQQQLYEQKLQTIKRINYLILPKEDKAEYEFIHKLYPGSTFRHVYGSPFSQNYDDACLMPTKAYSSDKPIKILIGNSADPTNNYLDAFAWIVRQMRKTTRPIQIYAILSYGDPRNKEKVLARGKALLKDAFIPIETFMNRGEYISFLNEMDVIVMYHNREQACGNIMTGITLGKPVLMKECSPIFAMLKQQKCNSIYDVSTVSFKIIDNIIQSALTDREKNMAIVRNIFSEEVRLNEWKRILCNNHYSQY